MKFPLPSDDELARRARDIAWERYDRYNLGAVKEQVKEALIAEREDLEILVLARGYVGAAAIARGGYCGADLLLKRIDKQMAVLHERLWGPEKA